MPRLSARSLASVPVPWALMQPTSESVNPESYRGRFERFEDPFSARVWGRRVIGVAGKAITRDFAEHAGVPEHGLLHVLNDPECRAFADVQSKGE